MSHRDPDGPRLRIARLVVALFRGHEVSARQIREEYRVSKATAKRDLLVLEQAVPVTVALDPSGGLKHHPRKTLRLARA